RLDIHNVGTANNPNVKMPHRICWKRKRINSGNGARQRYGRGLWRFFESSMPAWSDKMMFVPVDADTAIIEAFVSPVESNVLPNPVFVLGDEMLYSTKGRFLLYGEHEDQIRLGFDAGFIESAD